jgi:hypothetical protein
MCNRMIDDDGNDVPCGSMYVCHGCWADLQDLKERWRRDGTQDQRSLVEEFMRREQAPLTPPRAQHHVWSWYATDQNLPPFGTQVVVFLGIEDGKKLGCRYAVASHDGTGWGNNELDGYMVPEPTHWCYSPPFRPSDV